MFDFLKSSKKKRVTEVTEANFNTVVFDSDKPVLLDTYATWCQPCQVMQSLLTRLAKENPELAERIVLCKVDIEANPGIREIFEIRSVPTLLFIHDKKVHERHNGLLPYQELLEKAMDFSEAFYGEEDL